MSKKLKSAICYGTFVLTIIIVLFVYIFKYNKMPKISLPELPLTLVDMDNPRTQGWLLTEKTEEDVDGDGDLDIFTNGEIYYNDIGVGAAKARVSEIDYEIFKSLVVINMKIDCIYDDDNVPESFSTEAKLVDSKGNIAETDLFTSDSPITVNESTYIRLMFFRKNLKDGETYALKLNSVR